MTNQMCKLVASLVLLGFAANASQVEVIVAHHSEDLSWLSRIPMGMRIRIYTKGPKVDLNTPLLVSGTSLQQLPNVGRESHTYLHHIVDNYERLAQWSVFMQIETHV